jgi:hypothetical protein
VLADLQEVQAELSRRAAELTDWLDRQAAQYQAAEYKGPGEPAPAMSSGDLACVQAVSAAASRLQAAADAVAACASEMGDVDSELSRQMCRWSS